VPSLTGAWVTAAIISTATALTCNILHIDPGTLKFMFMLSYISILIEKEDMFVSIYEA